MVNALAHTPSAYPPDSLAIVHGAIRWTWRDLDRRSAQWCHWLRTRGVAADSLVAFAFPNGPEFIALTFGIYRVGATPAPISAKLPEIERLAIVDVMQPALFVAVGDAPDQDAPTALWDGHVAASWKACTSGGSTGQPKVIVDRRLAGFSEAMDFIAIPSNSVVLVPGPLYHNAPFSAAVFALSKGNTVVTMERFEALGSLELIAQERATWSIMVPTMLSRIMAIAADTRSSIDLKCWKTVVHTAAPMPDWLKHSWIEWLGADHIWEVYGATEGLVRCWIGGREWLDRPTSVGRPIGGGRLRILDEGGHDCPDGVEGEVYAMPLGGAGSTYRYIGANRRATADGWESVGDIGRVDAEGYLYLCDRRTDLIISGGVNIWPADVESALLRHPAIRTCAVIGIADSDLGQQVHALIESDDITLNIDALRLFLAPYIAREKHPRSITVQTTPVRDDAGKVRKSRIVPALVQKE
jgi:bile acid-coenzyme A ligase